MSERLLFTCTQNAVRSVIAEALFRQLPCSSDYQVSSCGVIEGAADGYAIAVMQEMGVDVSTHEARSFDSLSPSDFDTFSPMYSIIFVFFLIVCEANIPVP